MTLISRKNCQKLFKCNKIYTQSTLYTNTLQSTITLNAFNNFFFAILIFLWEEKMCVMANHDGEIVPPWKRNKNTTNKGERKTECYFIVSISLSLTIVSDSQRIHVNISFLVQFVIRVSQKCQCFFRLSTEQLKKCLFFFSPVLLLLL